MLVLFLLYYVLPLLYCGYKGMKDDDALYKKVAFFPIYNVFFMVLGWTENSRIG